jgi:hypothetical protein
VPAKILGDDIGKLISPKDLLWSGEDNTSPAKEQSAGKFIEYYKIYRFEAIAFDCVLTSVLCFCLLENDLVVEDVLQL